MEAVNTSTYISVYRSKSGLMNFNIVDDDVLEFDELFIVEFSFHPDTSFFGWNVIKGEPSAAFILIRDDDCELCSHNNVYTA